MLYARHLSNPLEACLWAELLSEQKSRRLEFKFLHIPGLVAPVALSKVVVACTDNALTSAREEHSSAALFDDALAVTQHVDDRV